MTAAQALASIREDIDRLEAKDLVKPGYIMRKRREVDAIERELAAQAQAVQALEQAKATQEEQHRETDLRLGMLANVLSMAGLNPMLHLRRPLGDNPDVYHDAAEFVHELRRAGGLINKPYRYTHAQLLDLVNHAIWAARVHRRTAPGVPINAKDFLHASEEESTSAAA